MAVWKKILLEGDSAGGGVLPDSYTKLLIHSNTTDGDASFTDSSPSEHSLTVRGETHHEVDQNRFGKTSIQFDGTGDSITVGDSTDWTFGEDDFTIDMWVYPTTIGSGNNKSFIGSKNNQYIAFGCTASGGMIFYIGDGSWQNTPAATSDVITNNAWQHVAVTRSSGVVYLFRNGILVTSRNQQESIDPQDIEIGAYGQGASDLFTGYMDEIRISKGIARWTSDFLPPSTANHEGSVTGIASLGIGTTTPTAPIHIQHSALSGFDSHADDLLVIERTGGVTSFNQAVDTDETSYLMFSDTTRHMGSIAYFHDGDSMAFRVNSATALEINSSQNAVFSGDVGIGGSPSYPLHITKADTGSGASAVFISSTMTATSSGQTLQGIKLEPTFSDGSQSTVNARGLYINPTFTSIDTEIGLYVDNGMTILDGGNVGIGTDSPSRNLHIEGSEPYFRIHDTAASKYFEWWVASGGGVSSLRLSSEASSNTLVVSNNGRVGIGTSSADSTLHVHTATSGTWGAPAYGDDLVIESDGDTGMSIVSPDADDAYIVFSSPSRTGSYNALIYSAYSSGSEFLAMNTYQGGETMRLTHEGRVGIKTSNPQRTLSVGSGDLQVWDGSDDSNIFIGQGNTVASPTYEHSVKTTAAGLFQIRRHHGTETNVFTIATDNAATFAGDLSCTGYAEFGGGFDSDGNSVISGTLSMQGGLTATTGTFSGILSSNSHLIVANGYSIKGGSGQEQIINMDGTTINIGGENNIVNTGTGAWTFGGNVEINGSSLTVDSTGNAILYMDGGDANYSGVWFGQLGDKRWEIVNHPTADKLYFNSGAGDNKISFTQAGDATFTGTIASGAESSVGIGTAQADANVAEVGPGYINLARDDTANAKQIQFTKNGSVHSYLETKGTGLAIGGAGVTMTGGDFEVYDADSTFGGDVDVTGTINLTSLSVTDGSAAAPSLSFSGDTDTGFYRAGADSMVLVTGGSPVLYMKSGYMGIGRGNPQAPLHIEKDADNTVADLLKITNSNDPAAGETGQKARITFQLRGSNDNGSNYYDTDAGRITVGKDADFITNNWTDADSYMSFETMVNGTETERMRIDSQGRVGIGQSPDGAFAVKGYVDDHHQVLELSAYDGDSLFNVRQSANNALIRAYADGGAQKIALHTAGESYFTGGNVGIGTSTPDFLLDVESTGTPTICVRNSAASADAKIIIGEPNTTAYGLEMKWKGSTGCAYFDNRYDHSSNPHMYFRMKTSGTPITALTINPAGNVGIGATPLYPLHVNTSTDKNLMVRDSVAPTGGVMLQSVNDADSAATAMELRGSLFSFQVGNVGIGVTDPDNVLEVNGDISTSTHNQAIMARYGTSNNYAALLGWSSVADGAILQLGNNNANNEIRAGHQSTGGGLKIITNNTADYTAAHNGTVALAFTSAGVATFGGNVLPSTDNSKDLGSSSLRWANIYVGDMHLKNDRGDWTVIEEEDYLSLKNNKNGKTYKLVMEEV